MQTDDAGRNVEVSDADLAAAQRVLDASRTGNRDPLPLEKLTEFARKLALLYEGYQVDLVSRNPADAEKIKAALTSLDKSAKALRCALQSYGQAGSPGDGYVRMAADAWLTKQREQADSARAVLMTRRHELKMADLRQDADGVAKAREQIRLISDEIRELENRIIFTENHPMPGTLRVLDRGAWLMSVWIKEVFSIDEEHQQSTGAGWIDERPDDADMIPTHCLIGQSIPAFYAEFFGKSGLRTSRLKKDADGKKRAGGPVVAFVMAILDEFGVVSSRGGKPISSSQVADILKSQGPRQRKRTRKRKAPEKIEGRSQ